MKLPSHLLKVFLLGALLYAPLFCQAGNYTNFSVALYIPINVVQGFDQPEKLQADWDCIRKQLKVDKVYIEVQRDRRLAAHQFAGQHESCPVRQK